MRHLIQQKVMGCWAWYKHFVLRRQTLYALLVILVVLLLIVLLSRIPNGAAQEEVTTFLGVSEYSAISENPLSLPYKLAGYAVSQFSDSIRSIRAITIVFFSFCVVAVYRILKRWHSPQIALFGAAMFATNAIAITIGRLGTPLILIMSWPIIISVLLWLEHGKSRRVAPFTLAVLSAGLLYVPGAPYFFLLLLILFSEKILKSAKSLTPRAIVLSISMGLLVIAPLAISFINNVALLKDWFLLPASIDWASIPKNILLVPSAFIFRGPENPLINVASLPVFDVASGGLFLIGLYAYQKHLSFDRTKVMLITFLLSVLLGALGQVTAAVILLLPFVYSVIGAGISYLLDEWFGVFPRNPIARSFGIIMISIIVIVSVYYQLTRFLVVWPNAPETRATYSQPLLVQ